MEQKTKGKQKENKRWGPTYERIWAGALRSARLFCFNALLKIPLWISK